ncbi:hypothetical protein KR200_003946 [Drosophila serrata]|nr:hypothetical protein KR200_003946 [Drosophila serrata]
MYAVRETRTSILRAARGPMPHALEHVTRLSNATRLRLSGEQAPSSCSDRRASVGSQQNPETPQDTPELDVTGSQSSSTESGSTDFRHQAIVIEQNLVLEAHIAAELASRDKELASRDLTIGLLQSKLEQSEKLASEQALQLSEIRSAHIAKKESFDRILTSLEMTNAKNIKVGAELQEQLESEQQWRTELEERIQKLEKDLELAEETIVTLQEQLEETTVHAEVRISEEEVRMQQEL